MLGNSSTPLTVTVRLSVVPVLPKGKAGKSEDQKLQIIP